jgi:uncharacterized protein (TIGR02611 family)
MRGTSTPPDRDTVVIEVAPGSGSVRPSTRPVLTRRVRARQWLDRRPRLRRAYRVVILVVGIAVTLLGVLLVPLPGPGWLIVLGGLWILGTEFAAARRVRQAVQRAIRAVLARVSRWRSERRARRSES